MRREQRAATITLMLTGCRGDIGNIEGVVAHRERLTALAAQGDDVWVGTSHGRLLSRQGTQWSLEGTLKGIQITGIGVGSGSVEWPALRPRVPTESPQDVLTVPVRQCYL